MRLEKYSIILSLKPKKIPENGWQRETKIFLLGPGLFFLGELLVVGRVHDAEPGDTDGQDEGQGPSCDSVTRTFFGEMADAMNPSSGQISL